MRFARFCDCAVFILAACLPGPVCLAQKIPAPTSQPAVRADDVSLDGYQQHLIRLQSALGICSKERDAKSCDPGLIGDDDRVTVVVGQAAQRRVVRYGWLRVLFQKAATRDEGGNNAKGGAAKAAKNEAGPPTTELLKDAKARLETDLAESRAPIAVPPVHARERAVMREVLAGKEFRNLQEQTVQDSVLERFARWLNHLFANVSFLRMSSAWIGRVLVWGFILGVCVALVYSLIRLERRWRVKLTPEDDQMPAPGAASARDWQLWLEDARRAAANREWREAIHFVYWAAISRLESRRLWPADRARTPREYLALVAHEDPRRPGLSQLTNTFERFWYGGREAAEDDYRAAESVATGLIGSGASPDRGAR
ncbi:DUF4129 domain-containing protein [Occallatibacter savannae]|uniref:DUF4129 domain-containing protein n=1 Tax=Occallatibacter savannae TaxID=1002691 RepID=UPI000D697DA0|nr:DUF4129 domain-containing protein [Occallatibacter savannae]